MKINEVIRQKRLEAKLTQSMLAKYLGVSEPAVSKWENGSSYPDITLLPALARALDTDMNTLLCFKEELSEADVAAFINNLGEKMLQSTYEDIFREVAEKIEEYPNCYTLILSGALFLRGLRVFYDDRQDNSGDDCNNHEDKIIQYLQRAANSPEDRISIQAKSALATTYMQNEDFDRAEEVLSSMPEPYKNDKRSNQVILHMRKKEYDEAQKIAENTLALDITDVYMTMLTLLEIALAKGDAAAAYQMMNDMGAYARSVGYGKYHEILPRFTYYTAQKDKENTLAVLKEMLASLEHMTVMEGPFFQTIQRKEDGNSSLRGLLATSFANSDELDFLADDPDYQRMIGL